MPRRYMFYLIRLFMFATIRIVIYNNILLFVQNSIDVNKAYFVAVTEGDLIFCLDIGRHL